MIAVAMVWSMLVGFLTSETIHYDDCKKENFKSSACEKYK